MSGGERVSERHGIPLGNVADNFLMSPDHFCQLDGLRIPDPCRLMASG